MWQQTFTLDPYGNVAKSGNQSFGASYVAANGGNTNRIVSNVDFAPNYDADGNLLDDPITGMANGFDVTGDAVVFQGATVVYDALGRAVEFTSAGETQEYLYGPGGGKRAVMNGPSLDYALVPLPGGGDAEYTPASGLVAWHHADHLGSIRLASTPGGGAYDSSAYAPYGELYDQTGSDPRFTGQLAAIATNNYDFPMREYSPLQGRWWTPNPAGLAAVDPANPQSWNRYAYTNGTPLNTTDPLGLLVGDGGTTTTEVCKPWNFEYSGGEGSLYVLYLGENCHEYTTFDGDVPPDSGGGGNQITTRTPQGRACSNYPDQVNFLAQNLAGASSVAATINVTPADILGLAASESWWGSNGATKHANNPLGLEAGPVFPGATGTWVSSLGAALGVYPSIAANFAAFAHGYGPQVRGRSAPASFAAALDNGPLHYSNPAEITDAAYIAQVTAAILTAADLLSCIH